MKKILLMFALTGFIQTGAKAQPAVTITNNSYNCVYILLTYYDYTSYYTSTYYYPIPSVISYPINSVTLDYAYIYGDFPGSSGGGDFREVYVTELDGAGPCTPTSGTGASTYPYDQFTLTLNHTSDGLEVSSSAYNGGCNGTPECCPAGCSKMANTSVNYGSATVSGSTITAVTIY